MDKIEINVMTYDLRFKIYEFIKQNWLLIAILILGAFLRLYKIGEYMTFLGDEGRDAIVVRRLLVNFDPILIGPGTSVGGMYLGPLYYYFMAPFLLLSNFSPVGPAVGVALLGVATIYLVFVVGKDWFSYKAGLIASLLFAISPTVIIYSRSSWNPNIMPFFALLTVYSIWKVWKDSKYNWLIICAISFAFVLNSHYLGILLAPVIFLFWILKIRNLKLIGNYLKKSLFALFIFLGLMSPLLIFDLRHNFMNYHALSNFLNSGNNNLGFSFREFLTKICTTFVTINTSLLGAKNEFFGKIISVFITISLFLIFRFKSILHTPLFILLLWLFSGILGFSVYRHPVYDHYFGFLFSAIIILAGSILSWIYENYSKLFSISLISVLVFINILNNPLRFNPNNQMQRSINVANKVLEIAEDKPFNLAVLAERNYEDGYRYFMELKNAQVMHADRWDQKTIVDNLIVICEKPKEKCDPTHSPKAEVANFGMSKIDSEFEIDGVTIYKLIHYK